MLIYKNFQVGFNIVKSISNIVKICIFGLNECIDMAKISYYTAEGLAKLRNDLEHMKTVERIEISEQIAEARDKGDLSENAEYDAAKEAQGILEMKIAKLEEEISIARVIDKNDLDTSKVLVLSKVRVKNKKQGSLHDFTLVSGSEADLKSGKISVESPIGKGLLGKKIGEVAQVDIPAGVMELEILDISR